ncbi:hypothetical protein IT882_13150 [Microbacterium schleiferi]|uniref:Uncharacterized protein n=1 Tax=Microbacterium schleiferi TaxID=69362 RepID=A0A7S8MWS8_9MICO|nr:hypothetical protein [Microbacterium schleiferi]QPE04138.1 hypothetical protein IT882_13150 [Microbacterium schleiferi]
MTRVVARIPAFAGRVEAIAVHIRSEDLPEGVAVDVTDIQIQPKEPTGVVPHPADIMTRPGAREYRNGVLPRSDSIIALGNPERASPTRVTVTAEGNVRVGSLRFGAVAGTAVADGEAGTTTQGWGRVPVVAERSDLQARVDVESPTHLTVEWADRY